MRKNESNHNQALTDLFWFRLSDRFFSYSNRTKILFFLLVIVITAIFSEGWLQPDEHARVLEPAHFLAYGYATLPWELTGDHPIVSFLLGAIHAPILMVTRSFHLTGIYEAAILRFFAGCVNAVRAPLIFLLLGLLGVPKKVKCFATFLFAFGVFGPLLMVRTSQEAYATTLTMISLFLILKNCKESGIDFLHWNQLRRSRGLLKIGPIALTGAFFTFALAASFRLQLGISAVFFGLWVLYLLPMRRWPYVVLGTVLGLLPMMIVDGFISGKPFFPAANYLRYALSNEQGGDLWGTDPWYWYLKEYFLTWFPPLSICLLPLLLYAISRIPILFLITVPFFLFHCVLGHKEMRYLHPLLPWVFIATVYGFVHFCDRYQAQWKRLTSQLWFRRTISVILGLYFITGAASILISPNSSPRLFDKIRKLADSGEIAGGGIFYVGNTMTSVSQFYVKHPDITVQKFEIDEYVQLLEKRKFVEGPTLHAFYAVEGRDLERMEKICGMKFVARNVRLKKIFDNLPLWIRQPRYYGMLECPGALVKEEKH